MSKNFWLNSKCQKSNSETLAPSFRVKLAFLVFGLFERLFLFRNRVKFTDTYMVIDYKVGTLILVTPGSGPFHLTPGVSNANQLCHISSVHHLDGSRTPPVHIKWNCTTQQVSKGTELFHCKDRNRAEGTRRATPPLSGSDFARILAWLLGLTAWELDVLLRLQSKRTKCNHVYWFFAITSSTPVTE